MQRKVMRGLMIALVAVFVMSTLAMAAQKKTVSQTIAGTITDVNMKTTTLTLTTPEGKTMNLKAAKNLLEGLKAGDQVKVEMVGTKVQAIRKQPAMGRQG